MISNISFKKTPNITDTDMQNYIQNHRDLNKTAKQCVKLNNI